MRALKSLVLAVVAACSLAALPARGASIDFSVGATLVSSGPYTVSFVFGAPIVPLTGLVAFTGTLSADLTDNRTAGDVSVGAVGGTFFEGYADNVLMGSDSIGGPLTADLASGIVFSGVFDCAAGCTSLQALLHFVLNGTPDDSVMFVGSLVVEPYVATVGEPATLALLLLVLVGLVAARMRRAPFDPPTASARRLMRSCPRPRP